MHNILLHHNLTSSEQHAKSQQDTAAITKYQIECDQLRENLVTASRQNEDLATSVVNDHLFSDRKLLTSLQRDTQGVIERLNTEKAKLLDTAQALERKNHDLSVKVVSLRLI